MRIFRDWSEAAHSLDNARRTVALFRKCIANGEYSGEQLRRVKHGVAGMEQDIAEAEAYLRSIHPPNAPPGANLLEV